MKRKLCSVLVWAAAATSAEAIESVPEWRSTGGPAGATAYDVVDTAEGGVLIGTEDGVWRLEPGETTWRPSGLGLEKVVVLGRSDDGAVFAAAHRRIEALVFRSTDAGRTWQLCEQGLSPSARWIWGLDPGPDGAMLAAGERGVFRFEPTTETWERYSDDIPTAATATTTDRETVYFGSLRYIYRSSDNGQSWQRAWVGEHVGINDVEVGPDGLVVATAELMDFWPADDGVVFISTDYGASFTMMDGEPGSGVEIGLTFSFGAEVLDDGTILVSGYRFLPYGPGGGVRASTDLGETWTSTGCDYLDLWDVELLDDGRLWAVGSESVVVHEGERWNRTVDGLALTDVATLASTPAGLLTGGFCVGASVLDTDDGSWRWLGPEFVTATSVAGTPDGGVIGAFTVYGTRRWTAELGWEPIGIEGNSPQAVAVDDVGTICVIDIGCNCSDDGGDSWDVTSFVDQFDMGHPWAMTALVDDSFVAALFRPATGAGMLVRTIDGGQSWESAIETPTAVKDLVWDGEGKLWSIRVSGEVAVSVDLGSSWRPLTPAGTESEWTSLAVDRLGRLYAGSSGGAVLTSIDGGFSWRPFDDGGFSGAVKDLIVHDGVLYAAVEELGVWATPVSIAVRGRGEPGRRARP